MLTIRLQRTGTTNKPAFRVVLAQAYRAAGKQALEVLGNYDPRKKNFVIKDSERLKYWLSQNVSVSPTVHNLLVEKKMIEGKKVKAWRPKKSAKGGSASGGKPSEAPIAAQAAAQAPVEVKAESTPMAGEVK